MRREAKRHLFVGTLILGFLSIFTNSQASSPFEAWTPHASRCVKGMSGPLSRKGRVLGLSLVSSQGIQTSLHLVRWNMSLNLSHSWEIQPSFELGHHWVHSTWGRKHRVPLTYLLLREGSPWGGCVKLAYLLSSRKESCSSQDDMGFTELSSRCCNEIDDPLYLRRVSQGISGVS